MSLISAIFKVLKKLVKIQLQKCIASSGKLYLGTFFDVAKVFDSVSYKLLLYKL